MSFVLLGILNAQAAGGGAAESAYDLLETTVLTSSASSISFTGLGSYTDYKHLQIRGSIQGTQAENLEITFNNDTGSNYANHRLQGQSGSVTSAGGSSRSNIEIGEAFADDISNTGKAFAPIIIDILDPFSSSKNTVLRALTGQANTDHISIKLASGLYTSTNSITSIKFDISGSASILDDTRLSLYGIKG